MNSFLMRKYLFLFCLSTCILSGCEKHPLPAPNNGQLGEAAHDLLSNDVFTSLEVQIHYMPGYQLQNTTISNFQTFLQTYLNKPQGISISQHQIQAGSHTSYNIDKLKEVESENRTAFTDGASIAIYVLIVNSGYDQAGVLGVAYRNTSFSLFGQTIHAHSGSVGQPSRVKLETTVLLHEMGHLLGLVDIGSPMVSGHKDPGHGSHCNNTDCLMYYAVETTDFLGFLLAGNIPSLDAACEADLQANGGL